MNNTILSVISGYAVTKSNRIAVISNKEQLTYSEFWKEICRAAHFFRENGINNEVGIMTNFDLFHKSCTEFELFNLLLRITACRRCSMCS